jgi:hypothetical protein
MDAKAYLAGCVMVAANLEAALMCMCNIYSSDILDASIPTHKGKPKPLLKWNLHELLYVARDCGWLPAGLPLDADWNKKEAKIGDYAYVLKKIRNLVHAGPFVAETSWSTVTKQRLEWCYEVFNVANEHLLSKIYASIEKHLAEDEQDPSA